MVQTQDQQAFRKEELGSMKEVLRDLDLMQSTVMAWELHSGAGLQPASRHAFDKGHRVPSHQKQTSAQQRDSTLLCTCLLKEPAEPPMPSRGRKNPGLEG